MPSTDERVLEVGAGSGYRPRCWRTAPARETPEIVPELAHGRRQPQARRGAQRRRARQAPSRTDLPAGAVRCHRPVRLGGQVPWGLLGGQLTVGGRLIAIVGQHGR